MVSHLSRDCRRGPVAAAAVATPWLAAGTSSRSNPSGAVPIVRVLSYPVNRFVVNGVVVVLAVIVLRPHKRRAVRYRNQFDCPGEVVRRSIEDRRGVSNTNHLIPIAIVAVEPFNRIPGTWNNEFVDQLMHSLLRQ